LLPLPPPGVHSIAALPELAGLLAGERAHVQSLVDDPAVSEGQRAYMRRWGWHTVLQVPLIASGRTLGVVEIVDPAKAAPFSEDEVRFCEALAATGAGSPIRTRSRGSRTHAPSVAGWPPPCGWPAARRSRSAFS